LMKLSFVEKCLFIYIIYYYTEIRNGYLFLQVWNVHARVVVEFHPLMWTGTCLNHKHILPVVEEWDSRVINNLPHLCVIFWISKHEMLMENINNVL
jgi:hypothetical protein